MKYLISLSFGFLVTLSCIAEAATPLSTQGQPSTQSVTSPYEMRSHSNDFVQLKDGTFGLRVSLEFIQPGPPHVNFYKSVTFLPARGKIVQDGQTLVWLVDGEQITVARTQWWYGPKWQTTPNAQLLSSSRKVKNPDGAFNMYESSVSLIAR